MAQIGLILLVCIAAPLGCTALVVLYLRAFRAETRERYAALQRAASPALVPVALRPAFAPIDETPHEQTGVRPRGPLPLAARVALLLDGDHGAAGMSAPRVNAAKIATLAALTHRGGARSTQAVAHVAGLGVEFADLPAGCTGVVVDCTLLVRNDGDAEALILWHAATRLLADAGIVATDGDAWHLAAALAAPGRLFEVAPASRRHG